MGGTDDNNSEDHYTDKENDDDGDFGSHCPKSTSQLEWEATTGLDSEQITTTRTSRKIKIDQPEKCSGKGKWKDPQVFDNWTLYVVRWMYHKELDPNTEEGLDYIGFLVENSALTRYNKYRASFSGGTVFSFILELRRAVIPSTSIDMLWHK